MEELAHKSSVVELNTVKKALEDSSLIQHQLLEKVTELTNEVSKVSTDGNFFAATVAFALMIIVSSSFFSQKALRESIIDRLSRNANNINATLNTNTNNINATLNSVRNSLDTNTANINESLGANTNSINESLSLVANSLNTNRTDTVASLESVKSTLDKAESSIVQCLQDNAICFDRAISSTTSTLDTTQRYRPDSIDYELFVTPPFIENTESSSSIADPPLTDSIDISNLV